MGVKLQTQISKALVNRENLEFGVNDAKCIEVQETEEGTVFYIQSIRKVLIPEK